MLNEFAVKFWKVSEDAASPQTYHELSFDKYLSIPNITITSNAIFLTWVYLFLILANSEGPK